MTRGASRKDLVLYLETFAHTVGVMQTREALRASRASARRIWPTTASSTPRCGSPLSCIWSAAWRWTTSWRRCRKGSAWGARDAPITVRTLLTAMRTAARSLEIADLAVRWRDRGVCGFDIAGAEAGYPPTRHLDAFEHIRGENFHLTIHAGEGFGLPSIWEALQLCGAERLGHGVRIVDDIEVAADGSARAGTAGGDGARPARSAGALSDVQRPFRGRAVDRANIRSGCSPTSGSASRSTRTTG